MVLPPSRPTYAPAKHTRLIVAGFGDCPVNSWENHWQTATWPSLQDVGLAWLREISCSLQVFLYRLYETIRQRYMREVECSSTLENFAMLEGECYQECKSCTCGQSLGARSLLACHRASRNLQALKRIRVSLPAMQSPTRHIIQQQTTLQSRSGAVHCAPNVWGTRFLSNKI